VHSGICVNAVPNKAFRVVLVILAGQQRHATPAQRAYQIEKASTWAVSVLYKAYAGQCGVSRSCCCVAELLLVLMLCCCQAVLNL
jgi:hypothetical protein